MRVTVVDADPSQLDTVRRALEAAGREVDGHAGWENVPVALAGSCPVVVAGWTPPDTEVLARIRALRAAHGRELSVLVLGASESEEDVVEAFHAGADDYMTTPVNPGELAARVQALRRRAVGPAPAGQRFGPVAFDAARHTVTVGDRATALPETQYELALLFFQRAGNAVPCEALSQTLQGMQAQPVTSLGIQARVSRLRATLNLRPANGFRLSAVYGIGYRLDILNRLEETSA